MNDIDYYRQAGAEYAQEWRRAMAMAKAKYKYFHYHFEFVPQEEAGNSSEFNFKVTKWSPDGQHLLGGYHCWGDDPAHLLCDCPAAMYHAERGMCKHGQMCDEYYELTTIGGQSDAIYFDSERERFVNP
jgi:hypothetical protein